MTISATSVRFYDNTMWVSLTNGRTLGVPLAWCPILLNATPVQRERVELRRTGLHYKELVANISIAGSLAGRGDMTMKTEPVAQKK